MSMIRKIIARVVIVIAFSGASWTAHAETITEFTKGMTAREGFFTFFVETFRPLLGSSVSGQNGYD